MTTEEKWFVIDTRKGLEKAVRMKYPSFQYVEDALKALNILLAEREKLLASKCSKCEDDSSEDQRKYIT